MIGLEAQVQRLLTQKLEMFAAAEAKVEETLQRLKG